MNAPAKIDRQAVELARYQAMVDALLLAMPEARNGTFHEHYYGLDALRAIRDWLQSDSLQEAIDHIAGNLPDHPVAEECDPYFSGRIAPFARALGGR